MSMLPLESKWRVRTISRRWGNAAMRITPGPDEEHKNIELNTVEARQGRTGQKVRYVLIFGLLGVVIAFVIIFTGFSG